MNKGSGLVEYILPIALIALVTGLCIYNVASSGSLTNFFINTFNSKFSNTSKTLEINKNSDRVSLLVNPAAGSLGGTPNNPVERCNASQCTIDFGEYILTGIPSNFSEFVNANGASGGVDRICNLFIQIADQLQENGDLAGAKDYRDLANLGFLYGDLQEQIENSAESCQANSNFDSAASCTLNKFNAFQFQAPDNVKSIIPNFQDENYDQYIDKHYLSLGIAMQLYKSGSMDPEALSYSPSFNMVKIFDRIIQNPNYSTSMRNVTTELYRTLGLLSRNTFNRFDKLTDYVNGVQIPPPNNLLDVVTGETTTEPGEVYTFDNNLINYIVKPISPVTNLDSTLICATGANNSNGQACN